MNRTKLLARLDLLGSCGDEAAIIQGLPDGADLWAAYPRGDHLLWLLENAGVDTSEMGFVCAERARQTALRAMPSSPEMDLLAACATRSWAAAAEARLAELKAIADLVRERWPEPPKEVIVLLGDMT